MDHIVFDPDVGMLRLRALKLQDLLTALHEASLVDPDEAKAIIDVDDMDVYEMLEALSRKVSKRELARRRIWTHRLVGQGVIEPEPPRWPESKVLDDFPFARWLLRPDEQWTDAAITRTFCELVEGALDGSEETP
ncbi:MAG TPA: hypothetical protein VNS09_16075 [Solirubrobacter sp.]|nr:hypothetical protein [Solirubrobacter sp.]